MPRVSLEEITAVAPANSGACWCCDKKKMALNVAVCGNVFFCTLGKIFSWLLGERGKRRARVQVRGRRRVVLGYRISISDIVIGYRISESSSIRYQ